MGVLNEQSAMSNHQWAITNGQLSMGSPNGRAAPWKDR
jgi:hypothetical protein